MGVWYQVGNGMVCIVMLPDSSEDFQPLANVDIKIQCFTCIFKALR